MIPIDNIGKLGMIFDKKPYALPPEAFSVLRNCRCIDGDLWATLGNTAIMGVPLHPAYYILPTLDNTDAVLWSYPGLTKIGATDGSNHADITRLVGDYTGTDANRWNGGNFGGISILNNGVDVPQAWIGPTLATRLVNLANWPANTTAKVVRPLGRFLVALDVTTGGIRQPQLVKWSDEADIGTVPVTWDRADATKKAGEWPLLETTGPCIDLLPLGERGIIYKSDSIHSMTRISGVFVFAFKQIFSSGLLAQGCAVEWNNKHMLATQDDVVIHDGFQMTSLLDDRMQRWFAGRVDQENAFRSFMAFNYAENEVWTCIPESGATFPNVALVTNVKDMTTTVVDISSFSHIDWGRPPGSSQVYDSFDIPFDSMVGYFGQAQSNAARKRMIAVSPLMERNQILQSEDAATTWTASQVTIQANVEGVADGLRPTAVNAQHTLSQSYTKLASEAQVWTGSIKAKADGYNFLCISVENVDGARAVYDLTAGTVSTAVPVGAGLLIRAGVEPVDGEGYRRCYLTVQTGPQATVTLLFGVADTATYLPVFTGDGVSRLRVKQMQFRRGQHGNYQATTTLRATSGFLLLDAGFDFDGAAFTSRAERTGLSVIGQTRTGEPKSDITAVKLCTEIMPKLEMTNGSNVNFYVGSQQETNSSVLWQGPFSFAPGDGSIYPNIEGKLIAIALETSNREQWRWDGYDIQVAVIGRSK